MMKTCFTKKNFVTAMLVDRSMSTSRSGKADAEMEALPVIMESITEMAKENGYEASFVIQLFDSKPEWLVGPKPETYEEIMSRGEIGWAPKGVTRMADAIHCLVNDVKREILPDRIAPIPVLIITDGLSTDRDADMHAAIEDLHMDPVWGNGMIIPIALGEDEFNFQQLFKLSNQQVVFLAKSARELCPVMEFVALTAAESSIGGQIAAKETIGMKIKNKTLYGLDELSEENYLIDVSVYEEDRAGEGGFAGEDSFASEISFTGEDDFSDEGGFDGDGRFEDEDGMEIDEHGENDGESETSGTGEEIESDFSEEDFAEIEFDEDEEIDGDFQK